ncbi:MAG TPA: xylulokinase, partial [Clostridiales bacterium]|nr:xylulokinase [Clostridiales bacterium]
MYIGIDLGTSSVKLLLVDGDGKIINSVTQTYTVHYPRDGWSEQNPEDWYSGVIGGIMRLLVGQDKSAVKGVGVGGQMHGL